MLGELYLTRISHQKSTRMADILTTTAFCSKNVLINVLFSTSPRIFLRKPCICKHLHNHATIPGEKCGLR